MRGRFSTNLRGDVTSILVSFTYKQLPFSLMETYRSLVQLRHFRL